MHVPEGVGMRRRNTGTCEDLNENEQVHGKWFMWNWNKSTNGTEAQMFEKSIWH